MTMVWSASRIAAQKPRKAFPDRAWLCNKENNEAFNASYVQAKQAQEKSEGEQTMSQEFKGLTTFLRSALKTVPTVPKLKMGGRQSSQRTCDLVSHCASQLQGVVKGTEEYKAVKRMYRKEITVSCRDDYRDYMDGVLSDMEACDDRGDSKGVQAGVHLISGKKKKFCSKQPTIDETGKKIALPGELAIAWGKFCAKKFAGTPAEKDRDEAPPLPPAHTRQDDVPTDEELEFCLKALACRKATGCDQVPIEAFRASGQAKLDLFALLRRIWCEEDVPDEMVICELVVIYKKGSPDDFANYRCLGMLTHAYKVLSCLLLKRMLEEVENYLPESQAGFRKLRSTRDNILLLATLMDAVLESQGTCVVTFIDLVAAVDSVSHKFLESALFEAGASDKSRAIFRAIYGKSTARVRVRTAGGEEVNSPSFPVSRRVIQGDIFSPLCFIVALESIMRTHGGAGTVTALGILIDRLEYADDAALVDADAAQASERVTRLCAGALADSDMKISAPKSEIMFVRPRVDTGEITAAAYVPAALKELDVRLDFKCKHCARGFDTHTGCRIHEARWCEVARVELTEEAHEIVKVLDARGSPVRRFYKVQWKGCGPEADSWMHVRRLQEAQGCVEDYWKSGARPDSTAVIEVAGENRCPDCNGQYKREQDLLAHCTRGCPMLEASRVGSRAEKAVAKARQEAVQQAAGVVMMGQVRLKNVFGFKYLGFGFQADGDRLPALLQRMAIARTRFGELHLVWRSTKLPTSMKLRMFACAVISVLTYGNEIWLLTDRVRRKLRGWCARCLAVITGRSFREETVDPSFDLVSRLRSRRLRWAGHILRLEETSLLRRVLLASVQRDLDRGWWEQGGLLEDAPAYSTVEQLLEMAGDRDVWRVAVQELLPQSDPVVAQRAREEKKKKASVGLVNGKLQPVL